MGAANPNSSPQAGEEVLYPLSHALALTALEDSAGLDPEGL